MIIVMYNYLVWEHYDDGGCEAFGDVILDKKPKAGDTLQLYWLDGELYKEVIIKSVDDIKQELHV